MKTYSIARIGSEYVVLAGERRILKVASRRKAAKLIVDGGIALGAIGAGRADGAGGSSIDRERRKVP